ncbi:MAG TPA: hypothetical protein VH083_09460 [Myxococcales bacterium]|nr:hypothetical protein [Myxococcales bacterium]
MEQPTPGQTASDHEIIGSDILSVITALPLADLVLGNELAARCRSVKPDGWYPISLFTEALQRVGSKVGRFGLLQLGRQIFATSHAAAFKQRAHNAADALYGINTMYRRANRGSAIGGWEMVSFRPGQAEMLKTTPPDCLMVEGIVSEALRTLEIPTMIEQRECVHKKAPHCRFVFSSSVTGDLWMGGRAIFP